MRQVRQAYLSWIPAEQGGRQRVPTGPTYSTVARFSEQDAEVTKGGAWSLVVKFIRRSPDGRHARVEVSFLSDAAPADLLSRGAHFELVEGHRTIARGVIADDAGEDPEEIQRLEALIG